MVTNNAWNSEDPAQVAKGGTGNSSTTAYAVQCGGTTATGPHQPVASVGTSGQVLTSNGAGMLPTFQAIPGPTNWVYIETQAGLFADSLDFTDSAISGFTNFCFMWRNLGPETAAVNINFRMSTDGGSSFLTSGYTSGITYNAYNSNTWTNQNQTSAFLIQYNSSSIVQGVGVMYVSIKNNENSISGNHMYILHSSTSQHACIQGSQTDAGVNAFQFIASSGRIAGQVTLFGIS